MKIESTAFTEADFQAFIGDYLDREREHLIARLRAIADSADDLAERLDAEGPSAGDDWNATETLAHVATTAAFFGWVVHELSGGNDIAGRMVEFMRMRDPAIAESVKQPPKALAQQLRGSLDRTIAFLETVSPEDLRNSMEFAGRRLSAEDFARLSLVHHLELHLEQMRAAMGDVAQA